ncbi:TonB-dependent receptor plug domain-containing protein [Mangrovibacterium diazotrophicum]|uniref:Iron complex outermembrane receptor protein n=1 Tax=Mangrovibacterium diazotrophicum TaxID=1261403 RepID=A0A419WA39_9BACT|nr:TonB-dependent receptor [Mangrovibacterium diazotrophicum]RKD92309.1 iron complex outermembrane receptor protein [Mangrovibacterium diazotrophicum]
MRRFVLSFGLLAFLSGSLFAQEEQLADSVLLHEVATYAPYKKYQAGAKVESIPTDQIETAQSGALDQLLMQFTPIYLKSNAGGLSTIRIRGTAADHTSVNFGGININSLTLGHSDFSSVPVYLFDGIDLQYGSSSAVNGSGSIGGAVYLGLSNDWTDGARVKATVSQGSFGEQLYGAKVFVGNGKFESVTRLYYHMLKNDFPFTRPSDGKKFDQQNAMIENMGMIQELNYRFNAKEWWKTAVWLEHDWHQVQALMSEHPLNAAGETLDNKHIRIWSEYENRKHALQYKGGLGFVHDMQLYNSNELQKIGTNRLIAEVEAKQDVQANFGYKFGAKYTYIKPNVYAYSSDDIDYEQRASFYLSSFYLPLNTLKLTLNLRQELVTDFKAPLTPSFGAEYRLLLTDVSAFKLTGNLAKSYRIPTFNDRFWPEVGNADLKPEKGMNYELALQYQYCSASFQSDIKVSGFYMDVKDWIEWRPGSVGWEPENRSRVISKGIEFTSNSDIFLNKTTMNFRLNYTFNPTEIKEDEVSSLVGTELIYTPKHMGNAYLMAKRGLWSAFADAVYTGERLADHTGNALSPDGTVLDAYVLMNCGVSRGLKIKGQDFKLSFAINNLLDKDYQNQPDYAMWGRNYRFTLSTDLNFNKNK